jgi:hypothetical protein
LDILDGLGTKTSPSDGGKSDKSDDDKSKGSDKDEDQDRDKDSDKDSDSDSPMEPSWPDSKPSDKDDKKEDDKKEDDKKEDGKKEDDKKDDKDKPTSTLATVSATLKPTTAPDPNKGGTPSGDAEAQTSSVIPKIFVDGKSDSTKAVAGSGAALVALAIGVFALL